MRMVRSFMLLMSLVLCSSVVGASSEPAPDKVRALLQMLSDPEVQGWI